MAKKIAEKQAELELKKLMFDTDAAAIDMQEKQLVVIIDAS